MVKRDNEELPVKPGREEDYGYKKYLRLFYQQFFFASMTCIVAFFVWWFVQTDAIESRVTKMESWAKTTQDNRFTDKDASKLVVEVNKSMATLSASLDVKFHEIVKMTEANTKLIHANALAIAAMPKQVPPPWLLDKVNDNSSRITKLEDKAGSNKNG